MATDAERSVRGTDGEASLLMGRGTIIKSWSGLFCESGPGHSIA